MCGPGLWSPQESHRGSWFPRQHRFPNGVLHSAQGLPTRQGPKSHLGCTPAPCSCTGNCVLQTVFVPEDSTLLRRQSYRQHQPLKGPRVLSFRLSQCLFFGGTYTDTGAHREACQKSHSKNNAPPQKKQCFPTFVPLLGSGWMSSQSGFVCGRSCFWLDILFHRVWGVLRLRWTDGVLAFPRSTWGVVFLSDHISLL